jgi:L-ornithine Nalpha-acyltransferase
MNYHIPTHFAPLPFEPITSGDFSVTLAQSAEEVAEAQSLRYHVFVEELKADVPDAAHQAKRDFDRYDAWCDHLLVRHHPKDALPRIIGTYRMLRSSELPAGVGFYSEAEYDISALKSSGKTLLEVGRSCTHPEFRSKIAMQLLWRGIGEYAMHYGVDYLFGCASFSGTNPADHSESLSYLYHHHRASPSICPHALPEHFVDMALLPAADIDEKRTFFNLPILVKGYLRLGGKVGNGAFIDHTFDTTDILMIVDTATVSDKHTSKYAPDSVRGGSDG